MQTIIKTKKPPLVCRHQKRQAGIFNSAHFYSRLQFYQVGGFYSMDLSALLGHGRENAVSSDFLAAQTANKHCAVCRDKICKARATAKLYFTRPAGMADIFYPAMTRKPHKRKWQLFIMYSPPAASMGCWPSHLLPGGWGCLWGRRTLKAIYEPKAFKAYLQTPLLVCWHN